MDLNKPILNQISKLNNNYQEWIHSSIKSNSLIMFENETLEKLTKTKWYIIPIVYIPIIILLLFNSYQNITFIKFILSLFYGIILWGYTEYFLHRFIFHFKTDIFPFTLIHFTFHGIHHKTPNDSNRLVFPPLFGILFFLIPFYYITTYFYHVYGNIITIGFILGYLIYDMTHYYLHHGNGLFLNHLRKRHLNHHFVNENYYYGVSIIALPLDYLFNTEKE